MKKSAILLVCMTMLFLGCSKENKDEVKPIANTPVTVPKAEDINLPAGLKVKKEPLNRRVASSEFEGVTYYDAAQVNTEFNIALTGNNTNPSGARFGKKSNGQYSIWIIDTDNQEHSLVYQFFKDGSYVTYNYRTQVSFWGYYRVTNSQNENKVLFDSKDPNSISRFQDVVVDNKKITFKRCLSTKNIPPSIFCLTLEAVRYDLVDEDYIDFIDFSVASFNADVDDVVNPAACFEITKAYRYSDYSEVDLSGSLQFMQFNPDGSLAIANDGSTKFDELWDYEYIEETLDPVLDADLYDFFGPELIGFKVTDNNNEVTYVYVVDIDYDTKEFYCIYYDKNDDDLIMFVMK
jgi:hypothetical protein